jgi:hypothetical protein
MRTTRPPTRVFSQPVSEPSGYNEDYSSLFRQQLRQLGRTWTPPPEPAIAAREDHALARGPALQVPALEGERVRLRKTLAACTLRETLTTAVGEEAIPATLIAIGVR